VPTLSLEATLDPGVAERILRAAPLASRREGRARGAPLTLTWSDTAEGALAAEGLVLEGGPRGLRRLVRVLPASGAAWHPGMPEEVVATLAPKETPAGTEDLPLVPFVAFDGRRSTVALAGGAQAVLTTGRLRAVAAEAEVARLLLSGPAGTVLEIMTALAAEHPLLPPRAALAEEGRALSRGEAPRPRRAGAPVLDPALGVEEALVLALGHLAEVLVWHAPIAERGEDPTGVHQSRVAIRRLRSMLRAFRPAADGPALRRFDGMLKGLAAVLGPARDWDVWIGGLGAEISAALPEDARIAALLRSAAQRREAAYAALRTALRGHAFREAVWEAVALAETRPWREEPNTEAEERRALPLTEFAEGVIERRWRRLVEAGPEIGGLPDAEFHALRLEGKRVRYVAELFAPLWGRKRARRFLKRLAAVQEAFGLANDASVARALVASLGDRGGRDTAWAIGVAEGWALARARRARSRAAIAWTDLLAADPFWDED
jgi:triphosphatase